MSNQAPHRNNASDNSILWSVVLVVILLMGGWYAMHSKLTWLIFKLKYAEASSASIYSSEAGGWALAIKQALANPAFAPHAPFSTVEFVADKVGHAIYIPLGMLLAAMAIFAMMFNRHDKARKTHSAQRLYEIQQHDWKVIQSIASRDLTNDESPEWAPGMKPETDYDRFGKVVKKGFCDIHSLVNNYAFDRDKATTIFIKQLGYPWAGLNALPSHTRALFAIFATRIQGGKAVKEEAQKALFELASMAAQGKMNYSITEDFLKKYANSHAVKSIVVRHGYVYTVMAGMLEAARADGILPSSEFLWLKPLDRTLWYVLNSIGRRTPWVEAAAPIAHFLAEKIAFTENMARAKRAQRNGEKEFDRITINGPYVVEAVNALHLYMKGLDLCD